MGMRWTGARSGWDLALRISLGVPTWCLVLIWVVMESTLDGKHVGVCGWHMAGEVWHGNGM